MEELFKQKLSTLKAPLSPKTFAEALIPNSPFSAPRKKISQPATREAYSEKAQVLESLERFAHEKAFEFNSSLIKLDGGELLVKGEPTWTDIDEAKNLSELRSKLSVPSQVLDIILNKTPGKVQVLFVTEKFRSYDEFFNELKSGFIDELIAGFPLKTAELFERMIIAMKLSRQEVCLYPIETEENDLSSEVMNIAAYLRPQLIVTLGAKATQKILKGQDRLSLIHGQFFTRKIENVGNFQIVPLFHPSIIETNQNMKKTAWSDMQKIMKHLKKL